MSLAINRRLFLAVGAVSAALGRSRSAKASKLDPPTGLFYARVVGRGLPPGTPERPARGRVVMLDGRALDVLHPHRRAVAPGRSALVSVEPDGGFSILYAQVD